MNAATRSSRRAKTFDQAAYDKFRQGHKRADFTPAFNASLEAKIADPTLCLELRFDLKLMLQSWGNQSDFAVHDEDRSQVFTQADYARALGVSRQTISRLVEKWQSAFYLQVDGSKLLPVEDPVVARRNADNSESCPARGDNFGDYHDLARRQFFEEHPEILAPYEEALQLLGRVKTEIRRRVRTLSRQGVTEDVSGPDTDLTSSEPVGAGHEGKTGPDDFDSPDRTESAPSLYKSENSRKGGEPEGESVLEGVPSSSALPETTTTSPSEESSPDQIPISAAIQQYGVAEDELVEELIRQCRRQAPGCTADEIVHYVHEKGRQIRGDRQIRNPILVLVTAVPKCFASENYRQYRAQCAELAPQTALTRSSPPGPLNYYEEKGNQDFIRDLEKEWDDGR